jgi:hypothetical protein
MNKSLDAAVNRELALFKSFFAQPAEHLLFWSKRGIMYDDVGEHVH